MLAGNMKRTIIIFFLLLCLLLAGCDGGLNNDFIAKAEINARNEFIIFWSNGKNENLGVVIGRHGNEVENADVNEDGELIITYADGTNEQTGITRK